MLQNTELELLANLRSDPAYMLLLDKIKALVDDLTDKLAEASKDDQAELFAYWKALRTIYLDLRDTPEYFASILPERDETAMQVQPALNNGLKKLYLGLSKIRETEENSLYEVKAKTTRPPKPLTFGNLT